VPDVLARRRRVVIPAPAGVLDAMTAAIAERALDTLDALGALSEATRRSATRSARLDAQAAWDALVGVSEVREEWGVRNADGKDDFCAVGTSPFEDADDVDWYIAKGYCGPDAAKVRRTVIALPAEPVQPQLEASPATPTEPGAPLAALTEEQS
jgi:hypothetical protein